MYCRSPSHLVQKMSNIPRKGPSAVLLSFGASSVSRLFVRLSLSLALPWYLLVSRLQNPGVHSAVSIQKRLIHPNYLSLPCVVCDPLWSCSGGRRRVRVLSFPNPPSHPGLDPALPAPTQDFAPPRPSHLSYSHTLSRAGTVPFIKGCSFPTTHLSSFPSFFRPPIPLACCLDGRKRNPLDTVAQLA